MKKAPRREDSGAKEAVKDEKSPAKKSKRAVRREKEDKGDEYGAEGKQ